MKSTLRRLNAIAARLFVPLCVLAVVVVTAAVRTQLADPGASDGPVQPRSEPPQQKQSAAGENVPPIPQEAGEPIEGGRLLLASADQLTHATSVDARLHQRIEFSGGETLGVGAYRQEPAESGGRFNLQLRTKDSTLQVVSDGAYVWRHVAVGASRKITRIDLQQYARLTNQGSVSNLGNSPAGSLLSQHALPLELTGIPHLLRSLAQRYRFGPAEPTALADVPVLEVRGVLDSGASEERPRRGESTDSAEVHLASPPPAQVPSHVVVSLGQDDLFPYRIVFECRNADAAQQENGVPTRIEIQFSEVNLGAAIDSRWFEYSPPRDVAWDDITAELVAHSRRAS